MNRTILLISVLYNSLGSAFLKAPCPNYFRQPRHPSSIYDREETQKSIGTIEDDDQTVRTAIVEEIMNSDKLKKVVSDTIREEVTSMIRSYSAQSITPVNTFDCLSNRFVCDVADNLCGMLGASLSNSDCADVSTDPGNGKVPKKSAETKHFKDINMRLTVKDFKDEKPLMTKIPQHNVLQQPVNPSKINQNSDWKHIPLTIIKRVVIPIIVHSLAHSLAGESIHGLAADIPELLKFLED